MDTCKEIVQAHETGTSNLQPSVVLTVDKLDTPKKNATTRETRKGCLERSQAPQISSDLQVSTLVTVATIRTNAAIIQAQFGTTHTEMILDSASAVSLVRQDVKSDSNTIEIMLFLQIQLVTASGDKLPITDYLKTSIEVEGQKFTHNFLVVDKLITPVILGIDFLQQHGLTINFSHTSVSIARATTNEEESSNLLRPIWDAEQTTR